MTKAIDLINRAYDLIGFKDSNEILSGTDANSGLDALNSMIDGWNTQRMFIVAVSEVVQSVSGLPITIGPGGTIDMVRPVRMESGAYIRISGADYAIRWVEREEYDAITIKALPGTIVSYGYYEPSLPLGKIYLWPQPTQAAELHLQVQSQLSEFADLVTEYVLAPGYRRAIEYSLAEELAPGKRDLPAIIANKAAGARRVIKRSNVEVPLLSSRITSEPPLTRFLSGR